MKYTALIPVKSLDEAKSRLATHLTAVQRASLMLDMLRHVICTLRTSQVLSSISVVSADTRVLERAQEWGASTWLEEQAGHNPALTAAAKRELINGSNALLTISADLPLLTTREVQEMVDLAHHYEVVLAPSQDQTGTNAILVRPPLALPYLFGVNSLPRHQREAQQQKLSHVLYSSLGLALDIDTIDDITQLETLEQQSKIGCL
ncbi:2-phospho-L-lactate guanylyltransferase [Tengunoibacter tsumagoiensis]|uniref:Phosphoenolpyruvate guanylyltransferase n=1 Tax=Tengunoibacter tsumagoiensis TaxID=2014871 RepID=A0A402A0U7_9CHLR|nr:2-phospho-L-lactate guanylyltransferase [Tengunoibacter tsumagoiensis]GCE12705.1 hypothetical protein KTT_25640 [Tengunoibacter tsumagoiensis]